VRGPGSGLSVLDDPEGQDGVWVRVRMVSG
jgi:hypothetical protein